MDEEEYDALTEEEKITFDREVQRALQERKKRELERLAKEMHKKKLQQELERQKEEEELKRRFKKPKQGPVKEEAAAKKPQAANKQVLTSAKADIKMDSLERKVSVREQAAAEKEEPSKKKKTVADGNTLGFPVVQEQEDSEGDFPKDTDKQLAQKFKVYELSLKDIQNILASWDRKQGIPLHHAWLEEAPHEPDDQRQVPSGGRRGRKERERERLEKERAEKERQERERAERERLEKLRALEDRSNGEGDGEEEREGKKDLGVPFIHIQVLDAEGSSWKQALDSDKLPKGDQILEILGLGSCGPPIPPPTLFSVISYPVKRLSPATTDIMKHFVFVTPPSDDLSLLDEKKRSRGRSRAFNGRHHPEGDRRADRLIQGGQTEAERKNRTKPRASEGQTPHGLQQERPFWGSHGSHRPPVRHRAEQLQ